MMADASTNDLDAEGNASSVVEGVPLDPEPEPQAAASTAARFGRRSVLAAAGLLLAFVITAPIVLNADNIIGWATDPYGLHLNRFLAIYTFGALDAAAVCCILISCYATWVKGERPGVIGLFVWAFAAASAFAGYRHGTAPDVTARDAAWFFPMLSLLGPALLEVVLGRSRRWFRDNEGIRKARRPDFGIVSWLPVFGAFQETFGAWRLAGFLDLSSPQRALYAYRRLTQTAGWYRRWRVLGLLRTAQVRAVDAAAGPDPFATILMADLSGPQYVGDSGAVEGPDWANEDPGTRYQRTRPAPGSRTSQLVPGTNVPVPAADPSQVPSDTWDPAVPNEPQDLPQVRAIGSAGTRYLDSVREAYPQATPTWTQVRDHLATQYPDLKPSKSRTTNVHRALSAERSAAVPADPEEGLA